LNPVVLIATHQRREITSKNIESLMMQSVQPKIVLGVSFTQEAEYYKRKYPEIDVYRVPNTPLGNKWQQGVEAARIRKPNPLIITGSDDILGIDFIENACILIKSGIEFIGISRWYVFSGGILYTYDYNASIPLGGGRCYSAKALNDINYNIFDSKKDYHLDDNGWKAVNSLPLTKFIVRDVNNEGLNIVSIKGDWPMLNPFDKFEGNRNVSLISKSRDLSELKQLINYGA
jgi:hypothetical protein